MPNGPFYLFYMNPFKLHSHLKLIALFLFVTLTFNKCNFICIRGGGVGGLTRFLFLMGI